MAVVSVAITLSFHLKAQPSPAERRMARPLGLVFWLLALACLALGLANYVSEFVTAPPPPASCFFFLFLSRVSSFFSFLSLCLLLIAM